MERVYKAGPRCQQLGQTFGLGFKPDPRDLCQIFTRSEIPSEDCLFNYQRRDNSGSARMGGPDDLLTPLARHKRDRNEWRTRYRPPNRASVAYEANLWPIGLDAADYKANIFFRYFAAVSLRVFRMSRRVRKNNTIVVIVHGFRLFSIYIYVRFIRPTLDRQTHFPINYRISFCSRTMKEKYTRGRKGMDVKRFMLLRWLNFLPRKS